MQVTGLCRIFKKELNGKELYSTSISNKNQNGDWDKMYLSVQLPRNVVLENGTDINITKGFLSFYKNNNGFCMPKIVIQEFITIVIQEFITKEEIEERQAIINEEFYQDNQNFDDSLPF